MKTIQQWYDEYAISHQNEVNQKIHFFCVPAIYFSIVGLLMSIPNEFLTRQIGMIHPLLSNWAILALIPVLLFYLRLSFRVFLKMFLFSLFSVLGNYLISKYLPLLPVSVLIFAVAWIGQFYGHKLEGKKPSFLKDLQFLLIGPAWVFEKISKS
jgi:uncharacterized membrane protein YGL010W